MFFDWTVKSVFILFSMKKLQPSLPGSDLVNTEQSIMATFDFLASENVDDDDEEEEDENGMANGDSHDGRSARMSADQLFGHANRFKVYFITCDLLSLLACDPCQLHDWPPIHQRID